MRSFLDVSREAFLYFLFFLFLKFFSVTIVLFGYGRENRSYVIIQGLQQRGTRLSSCLLLEGSQG